MRGLSKSKEDGVSGFTMLELLVVAAILGIVAVLAMSAYFNQFKKARDRRKLADLHEVRNALEEYHFDNLCYPEEAEMEWCGGTILEPYMNELPCASSNPADDFYYQRNSCTSFQIFAKLESDNSAEYIERVGCQDGCGPGNLYNYFVSSGDIAN